MFTKTALDFCFIPENVAQCSYKETLRFSQKFKTKFMDDTQAKTKVETKV